MFASVVGLKLLADANNVAAVNNIINLVRELMRELQCPRLVCNASVSVTFIINNYYFVKCVKLCQAKVERAPWSLDKGYMMDWPKYDLPLPRIQYPPEETFIFLFPNPSIRATP